MTLEPEFGHVHRPCEFVSVVSVIGMYETVNIYETDLGVNLASRSRRIGRRVNKSDPVGHWAASTLITT